MTETETTLGHLYNTLAQRATRPCECGAFNWFKAKNYLRCGECLREIEILDR